MLYLTVLFLALLRLLLLVGGQETPQTCPSSLQDRRCSCARNESSDSSSYLVRCLPSFIVAGTQKSGTTVLAAYLSGHPSLVLSHRKEVHFFDRTRNFIKGIHRYLMAFPYVNFSTETTSTLPLFGEATPFYLASESACRRISQTLSNTKILVLLREPIARAYSEYQMKKR